MQSDLSSPYLFALTNPGNEDLLKETVKLRMPQFTPSFSKAGFCCFKKQSGAVTQDELNRFPMSFARFVGIGAKSYDVKNNPLPVNYFDCTTQTQVGNTSVGDEIFFKVGVDQFWTSNIRATQSKFIAAYGSPEVALPEDSPSRAYLKIAQSFDLKEINSEVLSIKRVIELGCAPGGASAYLLSRRLEVFGVDPAQVDETIVAHKNFHYLNQSVQTLRADNFPGHFELLVSDMNLNPTLTLKFCIQVIELLKNPPKSLLITFKTPELSWCPSIYKLSYGLKKYGYKSPKLQQLPAHRRETLLYCTRGDSQ